MEFLIKKGLHSILNYYFFYRANQLIVGDFRVFKYAISLLPDIENKEILDIGCGLGRLLDFIPESCTYTGYDWNENYLSFARKKYFNRKAIFHSKDITETNFEIKSDIVFLIGILHHLHDDQVINLLKKIFHIINDKGILLTIDPVRLKNQNFFAKFIINHDRGSYVRSADEYLELIKKVFKKSNQIISGKLLNIPYNHVIHLNTL